MPGRADLTKRAFDALLAALALALLSPVFAVVALLVRRRLGTPVLFRQTRPGLHGHAFELMKFRTMTDARDDKGELRPDTERLTPFGKMLRATSLDELPELVNILRGDMSFVGPRPLLMSYLPHYDERQRRRHDVRPGLTGWAQVNGRNLSTWEDRLEMDAWYVDHRSLRLDLSVLGRTVKAVLAREGIDAPGETPMPRFDDPDRVR